MEAFSHPQFRSWEPVALDVRCEVRGSVGTSCLASTRSASAWPNPQVVDGWLKVMCARRPLRQHDSSHPTLTLSYCLMLEPSCLKHLKTHPTPLRSMFFSFFPWEKTMVLENLRSKGLNLHLPGFFHGFFHGFKTQLRFPRGFYAWEVALRRGLELHPFLRQHRQRRGRVHLRRRAGLWKWVLQLAS